MRGSHLRFCVVCLRSVDSAAQYRLRDSTTVSTEKPHESFFHVLQKTTRLRVLTKGEHELRDKLIPAASWGVLTQLREKGYRSYLVGGSVRDLLMKQTPKDFDIVTTAEPKQVQAAFVGQCIIVGRRLVQIRDFCGGHVGERH